MARLSDFHAGVLAEDIGEGETPPKLVVLEAIRDAKESPDKQTLVEYLIALERGTIKRKRTAYGNGRVAMAALRHLRFFSLVSDAYCEAKEQGVASPYQVALERVADETGESASTIDKCVYPRKKKRRKSPGGE